MAVCLSTNTIDFLENLDEEEKKEFAYKNIVEKDIFLIFTVSDFDKDELENIIIELNDNDYKEEFLKWMKT